GRSYRSASVSRVRLDRPPALRGVSDLAPVVLRGLELLALPRAGDAHAVPGEPPRGAPPTRGRTPPSGGMPCQQPYLGVFPSPKRSSFRSAAERTAVRPPPRRFDRAGRHGGRRTRPGRGRVSLPGRTTRTSRTVATPCWAP